MVIAYYKLQFIEQKMLFFLFYLWRQDTACFSIPRQRTYLSNRQDLLTEKDLASEETYFLVFGRENGLYKFHGTFVIECTIEKSPLTIIYRKLNSKFTFKWPTITPIDIALEPTYEELEYEAKHKKR